jgi:hypothetical protein
MYMSNGDNKSASTMTARKLRFSPEIVLLVVILTVAVLLRVYKLGHLGLYGDEDHTFFAVKNILEKGYPAMPSGMIYIRGIVHLALSTLSAFLFGLSEFSVRLPSVLASLAVISLLFLLAREVGGVRVGLVTSAIYALSAWDIEMARFARMYEVFLVLYLASTLAFYKGFIKGDKRYCVAAGILFVLTSATHALGIFLLTFPLSLLVIRKYHVVQRWVLGLYVIAIALIDRAYAYFVSNFFSQSVEPVVISATAEVSPRPTTWLASSLWSSMTDLPDMTFAVGISAFGVFLVYRLYELRDKGIAWEVLLAGGLMAIACLLQQFGIAFWLLVYALLASNSGYAALYREPWRSYVIFFIGVGLIWLVYGMYQFSGDVAHKFDLFKAKAVLRALFDYPFITLRQFLDVMPLLTILAIGQLAFAFHRLSVEKRVGGDWLLIVGALGPLTAVGFFAEWPYLQYIFMAYPFFVLAYATVLTLSLDKCFSYFFHKTAVSDGMRRLTVIVAVILTASFSEYHSLSVARSISERNYSSDVKDKKVFEYLKHPDHKTPATFVQNNKQLDDIVIAMDFITLAYLDRVDYMLRTEGSIRKGLQLKNDIYSGRPTIRNLDMLRQIFEQHPGKRIWLLTSHEFLGPHLPTPILGQEILQFLMKQRRHIIYTGADGITEVYLWEAGVSEI